MGKVNGMEDAGTTVFSRFRSSLAFTLIEIITVIAIIAVLLKIVLSAYAGIRQSAQKIDDSSHLKKIAAAWQEVAVERKKTSPFSDIKEFFLYLASSGRNVPDGEIGNMKVGDLLLSDLSVYISSGDKYATKKYEIPYITFNSDGTFANREDDPFGSGSHNDIFGDHGALISYCFVTNLPGSVPLDTTPLGFSRGLTRQGLWDEKAGLYGSKGGYIVYADGHLKWFDGDKPVKLLKWDQSGYTSNILEAVPPESFITCIEGGSGEYFGPSAKAIIQAEAP
jgi:prepilin-type N-terminal cleavage/methylation domain-containing protein